MSILLHRHTRVMIQGITGQMGRFSAQDMRRYGTQVVAGAVPGRGGQEVDMRADDRLLPAVDNAGHCDSGVGRRLCRSAQATSGKCDTQA